MHDLRAVAGRAAVVLQAGTADGSCTGGVVAGIVVIHAAFAVTG